MLQLSLIKEQAAFVVERLQVKNVQDAQKKIDEILDLDKQRRSTQTHADELLSEINRLAKEIGIFIKQGKTEEADKLKQRTIEIKEQSKQETTKLTEIETLLDEKLVLLPNLPHISVKPGKTADDNEIIHEDDIPVLPESSIPHWDLCAKYDIVDFELGVKITGAGFPIYKGKGARLQRALINFFLEKGIDNGYEEVQPPLMVNKDSGYGTCQLPDKDGQMYYIPLDDLFMVPTAEVPVTNIYRNVMLQEKNLPIKNVAYSSCFRREAGSYGKDVRGLNRLHQFDKVEIVRLEKPENSYAALDEMVEHVASLIRDLELPFRILRLCGGDISFASALTYDFEVYSAAQKRWLEVSSTSNFETFQSNRMKCRYKTNEGKTQLVHTLNGSALALPRIVAAILENNQTPNGIKIPQVLQKYTGFDIIN